jgi:hypothetical protein
MFVILNDAASLVQYIPVVGLLLLCGSYLSFRLLRA